MEDRIKALEDKYSSLDEAFAKLQLTLERQWIRTEAHFKQEESLRDSVTKLTDTAHKIEIALASMPSAIEMQMNLKATPIWESIRKITKEFDEFKVTAEKDHTRIKTEGINEVKKWINSHIVIIWGAAAIVCTMSIFIFHEHTEAQQAWVKETKAHAVHDEIAMRSIMTEHAILMREHPEIKQ